MPHREMLDFIGHYVELLKNDDTIKFQHKVAWNGIISGDSL